MPKGQLLQRDRPTEAPVDLRPGAILPDRPAPRTLCVYIDARDALRFAELIAPARLVVLPAGQRGPAASGADRAAVAVPWGPQPAASAGPGSGGAGDGARFLGTVLMTDIVESTATVARLGDRRWRELLAAHYADCGAAIARAGGEFVDTTGDGIVATFDLPTRAVRAATAMQEAARRRGIALRAGIHTGECERLGGGVVGMAVHIAARICALAGADEILATGTVRELAAGSALGFEARGRRVLRGLSGEWPLFATTEHERPVTLAAVGATG